MRFKIDENLPAQCVGQLCEAGHDALSVHDGNELVQPTRALWVVIEIPCDY